ncbi:MAG: hypothetical protein AB7U30_10770 [Sulfuricellaceae bacterium]
MEKVFRGRLDFRACGTCAHWRGVRVVEDDGCAWALAGMLGMCLMNAGLPSWTLAAEGCEGWEMLGLDGMA